MDGEDREFQEAWCSEYEASAADAEVDGPEGERDTVGVVVWVVPVTDPGAEDSDEFGGVIGGEVLGVVGVDGDALTGLASGVCEEAPFAAMGLDEDVGCGAGVSGGGQCGISVWWTRSMGKRWVLRSPRRSKEIVQ